MRVARFPEYEVPLDDVLALSANWQANGVSPSQTLSSWLGHQRPSRHRAEMVLPFWHVIWMA